MPGRCGLRPRKVEAEAHHGERRDEQGRKLFWARGNGWVFAGIANMLDLLPQDHADRPRLEKLFRAIAGRLLLLDGVLLIAKRDTLPRTCRDCTVRFACNGGCPKDRFLTTQRSPP